MEYDSALKNKENSTICNNMDRPGRQWLSEISQTQEDMLYDLTYM